MSFIARSFRGSEPHDAVLACSFCGATQREVVKMIAGPAVYICDRTIRLAEEALATGDARESGHVDLEAASADATGRCGFCGKADRPVVHPAGRDDPRICDECIALCVEINAEELADLPEDPPEQP